jgi:AcrR family transcriptional regulator
MDGRQQRGERTRHSVATKAAALASTDGLAGMSIGQIAVELDIAKSSVQVAYPRKEDLQLATISAATDIFVSAVIAPALSKPKGLQRLLALIDNWVDYISNRVLPGGCFMGATFAEFDSKPGPVRDALADTRKQWLGLIEREAAVAQSADQVPAEPRASLLAFEIDALLAAANIARNLHDDDDALQTARQIIHLRLGIRTADTALITASRPLSAPKRRGPR